MNQLRFPKLRAQNLSSVSMRDKLGVTLVSAARQKEAGWKSVEELQSSSQVLNQQEDYQTLVDRIFD